MTDLLTKEQEAQQAQTIAGIKLWFSLGRSTMKSSGEVEARKKVSDLLKIVDSQAQKITELSALFQKAGNGAIDLAMKCSEQELKIAEQAKEIERLKDRLRFEMQARARDGM